MIKIEDLGHILPTARSGKIVGIATHRGEYCIVACEYGLYKLWDDYIEGPQVERTTETVSGDS